MMNTHHQRVSGVVKKSMSKFSDSERIMTLGRVRATAIVVVNTRVRQMDLRSASLFASTRVALSLGLKRVFIVLIIIALQEMLEIYGIAKLAIPIVHKM